MKFVLFSGGVELRLLDQTWMRQKISMVGQEPTLFAYSIKENIAYGREATDDEVGYGTYHSHSVERIWSCRMI